MFISKSYFDFLNGKLLNLMKTKVKHNQQEKTK